MQPGMVYLSHPTEQGTVYTAQELTAISQVCREFGLTLFVDGARLAYGLAAEKSVTLPLLYELCDVFYLGGTKVGALFGEAVVISNPALARDFRYLIKQRGGMLAKGRLLGVQFETLLEDGLYFRLGENGVEQARKLSQAFQAKGYPMRYDSPTNQLFPVLPDAHLAKLADRHVWSFWEKVDADHTAVRFCTSWCTTDAQVAQLVADLKGLSQHP